MLGLLFPSHPSRRGCGAAWSELSHCSVIPVLAVLQSSSAQPGALPGVLVVPEAWHRRIFPLWHLSHAGGAAWLSLIPGRVDGAGTTPGLGQGSWAGAGTANLGPFGESPAATRCPLERIQGFSGLGASWERGAAGRLEKGHFCSRSCAGRRWHRERGLCPQHWAQLLGERNGFNGTSMVAASPAVPGLSWQ